MKESMVGQLEKTPKFNFELIKRPFTIEDLIEFLEQFKKFRVLNQQNQTENGTRVIAEKDFYLYLITGSFGGVERAGGQTSETLTAEDKQKYDNLLLLIYKGWRTKMIKNQERVKSTRPEVIRRLGELTQLPDPETGEEIRDLYAKNLELNKLSAASYQEKLVRGKPNYAFLHIWGHRYHGYEYEQPKREIRFYLNPPINEVPELVIEFMRIADERGMPYHLKIIDFGLPEHRPEVITRADRMVIYTDQENAGNVLKILEEIKDQHPEWFANRFLPPMTAKIIDGVGFGEEPNDHQKKTCTKNNISFNEVRAKFFYELFLGIVKNILLSNPDLKLSNGRSLRDIFNDYVQPENRRYLDILWGTKFDPLKINEDAKRAMNYALSLMIINVLPNLPPEYLMHQMNQVVKVLGPKFGIDPNNMALNLSNTQTIQ